MKFIDSVGFVGSVGFCQICWICRKIWGENFFCQIVCRVLVGSLSDRNFYFRERWE